VFFFGGSLIDPSFGPLQVFFLFLSRLSPASPLQPFSPAFSSCRLFAAHPRVSGCFQTIAHSFFVHLVLPQSCFLFPQLSLTSPSSVIEASDSMFSSLFIEQPSLTRLGSVGFKSFSPPLSLLSPRGCFEDVPLLMSAPVRRSPPAARLFFRFFLDVMTCANAGPPFYQQGRSTCQHSQCLRRLFPLT